MLTAPESRSELLASYPPEVCEPFLRLMRRVTRPLERFLQIEAASGILLLIAAGIALIWINSSWSESYVQFWQTPIGIKIGTLEFERTLLWIVNDVLMVLFFFIVGMEIRREIYDGQLSEWRKAALPIGAAIGGMIVPALIYGVIADGPLIRIGWGVPMATDIAFAVGVLTLLGNRVPPALRILLLALAIIDDLGAILVIAFFYSSGIAISGLLIALVGFCSLFVMQRLGVRAKLAYILPSALAWAGIYKAGIHPTFAGVIVGFATPVHAWLGTEGFLDRLRKEIATFDSDPPKEHSSRTLVATLRSINFAHREAISPADSLIKTLHPWVAFIIMPIFALANAGVLLSFNELTISSWNIIMAVTAGLVAGKPIGIFLMSWLMLRLKLARLPADMRMRHLIVLGLVGGIGFTMALFIAQLAFADVAHLAAAKIGILLASSGATVLGLACGRFFLTKVSTK